MFPHLLFALAITAAAMLFSGILAAIVTSALEAWRRHQRAHAREDEIALLGASVQRWRLTPPEWGGASSVGFEDVSLEAIGATVCPILGQRRTASGVYRIVHVPSGPVLDRALARVGRAAGTDGVLVIGRDPETFESSAAIVLGPLLQIPLATVPWHMVTPALEPSRIKVAETIDTASETVSPVLEGAVGEPTVQQREHARSRRMRAPDRGLALALWPTAPEASPVRPRWPGRQRSRAGPDS